HLRVLRRFDEGIDGRDADVLPFQKLPPFIARAPGERLAEEGEDLLLLLAGGADAADEALAVQLAAEAVEEPGLVGADGDVALLAGVHLVLGRAAGEAVLAAQDRCAAGERAGERGGGERHYPLSHRDVHVLAAAGTLARDQRRQDADGGVHATAAV